MTEFIMQYWIEALFGGNLVFIPFSAKYNIDSLKRYFKNTDKNISIIADDVKDLKVNMKDSKTTNRTILKDRLNQKIEHLLLEEYCSIKNRAILTGLYTEFKKNGGNGGMRDLMDKVYELPVEPPDKEI
jgi:hypothetical protein